MPFAGGLYGPKPSPLSPVLDAEFPGSHYTLQSANPKIPQPHLTLCDVAPLTGPLPNSTRTDPLCISGGFPVILLAADVKRSDSNQPSGSSSTPVGFFPAGTSGRD
jgi:hypothetical protein